jgi:phosphoenolpyruvate phosphomutase
VSSLPIFANADNGYGSDRTAIRAVREFENAGAAAMCAEDNDADAGADAAFVQANAASADKLPEVVETASQFARLVIAPTALP